MLFWKVSLYIKRENEVAETMMKYNTIQALKSGILNENICPIKARIISKNEEYQNNL